MSRLLLIIGLFLILVVPQAGAQSVTHTYPNPYRQTMWNTVTDTVHTLGQSPSQARMTKMRLHQRRTLNRLKSIHNANMAKFKAKRLSWLNSQQPN